MRQGAWHGFGAPCLPYGVSVHHAAFPWTLSISPQTLTDVVFDIGESLLRHGVSRLLVVSAYDGNPAPIENAAGLLADRHGIAVPLFSGWQGMARRLLSNTKFGIDLDHGGRSELSMAMHRRPEAAPRKAPRSWRPSAATSGRSRVNWPRTAGETVR